MEVNDTGMSHPAADSDELILHNANIITLDPRRPRAQLAAIKGGRIDHVGKDRDMDTWKKPHVATIDCRGGVVVPGFIDAHTHFLAYAFSLRSIDCSPAAMASVEDIVDAIARRAEQRPRGSWIKGAGYDEFYLAEKRHPSRWDMDRATSLHPVKLTHRSGHACVLNSYALRLAGITVETPEPEGGVMERDTSTGEPTGLFYDLNEWLDERLRGTAEDGDVEGVVRMASERYLSMGITSFHDATPTNSLEQWRLFRRLKGEGVLIPRASMMVGHRHLQGVIGAGLAFGAGDDELRLGPVKVLLSWVTGSLHPSRAALREIVQAAASLGFPVAIHAVEKAEVEAAISALEEAKEHLPGPELRHRIEHCSLCSPVLQKRLRRLGVVIVTQPGFVYYSGERYLSQVPRRQLPWLYPIGSLRKTGLRVAGSSDSPVAPPSPLVAMCAAVTRRAVSGEEVGPSQRISALEALKMYTLDGAFASYDEDIKGTIEPGKLADMVILSDDPTNTAPEDMGDIEVCGTVIGGKLVWQKEEAVIYCAPTRKRATP